MKRTLLIAAVVTTVWSLGASGQSARAVIDEAAQAMGATGLQSIRYSGTGSTFGFGQAPAPGAPWPRFEVLKYVAAINYAAPAMREQLVRLDVEDPPRGGGAGPFNPATGQGGMRPIPGEHTQGRFFDDRTDAGLLQIWLTPHGFLEAAADHDAALGTATVGGRTTRTISFTALGKYTVTGTIDSENLVERVQTTIANSTLGDMLVEAIYSEYEDFAGVRFPTRILQRQAGHPTLELTVGDVQPNSAAAGELRARPAPPAPPPLQVEAQEIADGVWFLTGGAPLSLLVEFDDHFVVIEGPQNDAHTSAVIAEAARLNPAKPIRYVVNTHHHFDHAGGLRGFVAAGIPILTHRANEPYYTRIFQNPFLLDPDALARSDRRALIETVDDRRVLTDGTQTLELYHVRGNFHDEALLMAYLPNERMLVQADAFHPRPGAAPLPAPSPFTVNLLDNIERLGLDVETLVHVHGGTDPFEALLRAAGRGSPQGTQRTQRSLEEGAL
jgi:glyoxylase-like metal-dependent hydrolase (beta-lactamase superfamily II)